MGKRFYIFGGTLILILILILFFRGDSDLDPDLEGYDAGVLPEGASGNDLILINDGENSEDGEDGMVIESPSANLEISVGELAMHNNDLDCWVGFEGRVYDLTDWLDSHPGGKFIIERHCGTSEDFERSFIGKHMRSKVNRLQNYLVGDLV